MNELRAYFEANPGRMIHKWLHYFEIYERYLARYRDQDVVLVEIGGYQGGSLQMWKHYLGAQANIWGIDVNPLCKDFGEDRIHIASATRVTGLSSSRSPRRFPASTC